MSLTNYIGASGLKYGDITCVVKGWIHHANVIKVLGTFHGHHIFVRFIFCCCSTSIIFNYIYCSYGYLHLFDF